MTQVEVGPPQGMNYHALGEVVHNLWRHPAEVIKVNKGILASTGEPIVERLATSPLPLRLYRHMPLSPEQIAAIGLGDIPGGQMQLSIVRDSMFSMTVYGDRTTGEEHVAVIKGIGDGEDVPVRIHSSCLTAETFHASNCECHEQLGAALNTVEDEGVGAVVWLHQEGRGNGLAAKAEQLRLMIEKGMDTVQAYESMGLPSESRDFTAAADMLKDLGIRSIRLITNNPDKIAQIEALGIRVNGRIPCEIAPINDIVRNDLRAKRDRHGHLLNGGI